MQVYRYPAFCALLVPTSKWQSPKEYVIQGSRARSSRTHALTTYLACRQALMAEYSRLHVAVFGEGDAPAQAPLQRMHYSRGPTRVALAVTGPELVTYALFEPSTELSAAVDATQRLCTWLRSRQADLFMPF